MLNLNCFIPNASLENDSERETIVKCDDCSTTDSGSALDDDACHSVDTATTVNGQDLDYQEEDEGNFYIILFIAVIELLLDFSK